MGARVSINFSENFDSGLTSTRFDSDFHRGINANSGILNTQ